MMAALAAPAGAKIATNGENLNGESLNGISHNGVRLNGSHLNGRPLNGPGASAAPLEGAASSETGMVVLGLRAVGGRLVR